MQRLSKDALLGASDLVQEEVELPLIEGAVLVQGLGAKFSNEAQSQAMKMTTIGREQVATIDTAKLEAIQILNGLLEPKLDSLDEAEAFMAKCGPSVRAVVDKIDELSGLDKKAIEEAKARFPRGGESEGGSDMGDAAPDRSPGPAVPA